MSRPLECLTADRRRRASGSGRNRAGGRAVVDGTPGALLEHGRGLRPATVSALASDLSSIASAVGRIFCEIAGPVSAGLPGSDTAMSCAAADAALHSAIDGLRSAFSTAGDTVSASLARYQAADAENADLIGKAGR